MLQFPYKIRPIRAEKDSAEISALIKLCFKPWLDYDNIQYLDRLEKAGRDAAAHPFLTGLTGFPYDSSGVVCEDENGKILGVINTFMFQLIDRRCCLIANVCVDPARRKHGIAAHMIADVERTQKNAGISGIYLQARMENPDVISFYRKAGFQVTDYRETWIYPVRNHPGKNIDGYAMESVPPEDEAVFRKLFTVRYPRSILWNLDYRRDLFSFGKLGELESRLRSGVNRFRRVIGPDKQVKAWAAYQKLENSLDTLWFLPNDGSGSSDRLNALMLIANKILQNKPVKMDVPAERESSLYTAAGFILLQRLAWMWKKL